MMRFELNDAQEAAYKAWAETHPCKYRTPNSTFRYVGCFGGADTFQFIPTSIGGVVTSACCACGACIDLTEPTTF